MTSTLRELTTNFQKLDKFEGVGFRRWQKKMHFLLTSLKVAYLLSTPMPPELETESLEYARTTIKWKNNDFVCCGHILNGMSDTLFDIYQNVESAKELWDLLESKYMAEDASSKKFLILRILGQIKQHNIILGDAYAVASIIDKLPPSWKETKNKLKREPNDLSLEQLGETLLVEEGIKLQEGEKEQSVKDTSVPASTINVMEEGQSSGTKNFKKRSFKTTKSSKGNKKPNKAKQISCWECGGPHLKRDCRVWKKKKLQQQGQKVDGHENQGCFILVGGHRSH